MTYISKPLVKKFRIL